jgi:ATP-dependent exoDNAse (exonuclease V) alpha subunit
VKVIAPTGVAAFNINGTTIHSTLSIPIFNNKCSSDLDSNRLKQLQERLQDVIYLVIDEKSMVGRRMLALIDKRLREAFPENKNEPFGGRFIILLGDFGQLPPVLDFPMYANNVSHDTTSNDGIASYKSFREVYKLDIVQRQSGDSEEQQGFRELLLRLRNGDSSLNDWEKLSTRFEGKLNRIERDRFLDAVFILTIWADVDKVNIDMLRSLNQPVAKILAVHTGGREAKKAISDVAKGLEAQLLLAKGTRIMLTANLWTEGGLVNGSMGIIHDIIFVEQGPPSLPVAVFVKFDHYKGPSITTPEGDEIVPIVPIKRT